MFLVIFPILGMLHRNIFLMAHFLQVSVSSSREGMKWPLCLPSGSVQGFLLPLGSFRTHIKLFCFTQHHAGGAWELCGLPLIQLSSSAHSSFLFLKEMIGSCCFPDSTQKKGMGSF